MHTFHYEYGVNNKYILFSTRHSKGQYEIFDNHFHPYFEFYYLKQGYCDYFIKDKLYHVKAGDLVLIDKYSIHKTLYTKSVDSYRYLFNFSEEYIQTNHSEDLKRLLQIFKLDSPLIRLDNNKKNALENLIVELYKLCQLKRLGFELEFENIFLRILLFINNSINEYSFVEPKKSTETEQKILDVANYIHHNYNQPLSLSLLSKEFFISPYYLSHRFKEVTGFTLSDYIQSIRIKEAQELLRESSLKIIDISELCGFGSISQFRRVFSKYCGVSPSNYRKITVKKR